MAFYIKGTMPVLTEKNREFAGVFSYICPMKQLHTALLLLGGNIGPLRQNFFKAEEIIAEVIGPISLKSSTYKSEPWGFESPHSFLNKVLLVKTLLSPEAVLEKALEIETILGRNRLAQNSNSTEKTYVSRIMDIDLLYFDEQIIDLPHLQVPHPGIPNRKFTLLPLAEIIPDFVHPVLKLNQRELLAKCPDNYLVEKASK